MRRRLHQESLLCLPGHFQACKWHFSDRFTFTKKRSCAVFSRAWTALPPTPASQRSLSLPFFKQYLKLPSWSSLNLTATAPGTLQSATFARPCSAATWRILVILKAALACGLLLYPPALLSSLGKKHTVWACGTLCSQVPFTRLLAKWVLSMSLAACQLALSEADTGEEALVRAGWITIVREAANTPPP